MPRWAVIKVIPSAEKTVYRKKNSVAGRGKVAEFSEFMGNRLERPFNARPMLKTAQRPRPATGNPSWIIRSINIVTTCALFQVNIDVSRADDNAIP
jgi:hypothetical protein